MREVSAELVANLTTSREFDARLTFRDTRLVFDTRVLDDSLGLSDPSTADVCVRGTGFFRVVNYADDLYYQNVADPTLLTWPNWVDSTVDLKADSRPGVEDIGDSTSRIWYQKSTGDICYRDYNGALGDETIITAVFASYILTLAPVNATTCYIHWLDGNWGAMARVHTSLAPVTWQGRVYGDCQTARYFDAVHIDEWDYLYVADNNYGRLLTLKTKEETWSDLTYVVPLDVVDDTSYLQLAYVSVINNKAFLTGRLSRSTDYGAVAFDMYTIGPGNYTMGRDLFITETLVCGKLFLVGEVVWYVGVNKVGEADATMLVGVDLASKKLVTQKFSNFRLSCVSGQSFQASMEIDPSLSDNSLIRRGADATLEVAVGNEWCTLATLNIDGISKSWDQASENFGLVMRTRAMKKLSRWTSDQSYDYWSQAKQSSDPAVLDEVVRTSGQWVLSNVNTTTLKELNVAGVLYLVAKPSRGGLMRTRFYKPAGDFDPLYGVVLNYYHETRRAAATRLEKDPNRVTDNELGHNGIVALWGDDQHEGGAGVALYFWHDNELTKFASGAQAIPDNTWHWLQITFADGLVKAFYRADASTDWIEVVSAVFDDATYTPWRRETFGRGALYIRNRTPYSTTPGFTSTSTIIPVADVTDFPISETVIVDEEQIEYDGKATGVLAGTLARAEAITLSLAIHDNNYFANIDLHSKTSGSAPGNFNIGKAANQTMAGMSMKTRDPPHTHRVSAIRYRVRKVGSPGPLYCYYCNDAYDNYATPPSWAIIETDSVPAANIGTSYSWIEFNYDTNWLPPYGYWAFLTMTPPGQNPVYNANNYYQVEIDTTTYQVLRVYNHPGWTSYTDKHAYFQFIGADRSGDGHEIYIDGAGAVTLRHAYDDLALVVTAGPGKGSVFRITDYDFQAPRQWAPNRTYEAPDTWQDHIDDAVHGAWTVPDMSRIFVAQDPSSIVGPGSKFQMKPSLKIKAVGGVYQRGLNGTSVTSHSETLVSVYRDLSVQCDRVEFYSSEQDWRMEDMIQELGTKAGVLDYEFDQALKEDVAFQSAGWNAPRWLDDRQNFIMTFKMPDLDSGDKVGAVFRSTSQPTDITTMTQGYLLTITDDHKLRFSVAGVTNWVLRDVFPMGFVPNQNDDVVISCQEDAFSVWIGQRFVYTFRDGTWDDGENAGLVAYNAMIVPISWSNLDRRVDNFIFDMGRRGAQLLGELIGPKRIYYQDNQYGALRVFRARTNIGTLPNLNFRGGTAWVDTEQVTRVRSEGYEIAEVVDWTRLKGEGNLFALINATEANDAWEAYQEGLQTLKELAASAHSFTPSAGTDPRVEPNDLCTITLPNGNHNVLVTDVNFIMIQDAEQPLFDMDFGAIDADQL